MTAVCLQERREASKECIHGSLCLRFSTLVPACLSLPPGNDKNIENPEWFSKRSKERCQDGNLSLRRCYHQAPASASSFFIRPDVLIHPLPVVWVGAAELECRFHHLSIAVSVGP